MSWRPLSPSLFRNDLSISKRTLPPPPSPLLPPFFFFSLCVYVCLCVTHSNLSSSRSQCWLALSRALSLLFPNDLSLTPSAVLPQSFLLLVCFFVYSPFLVWWYWRVFQPPMDASGSGGDAVNSAVELTESSSAVAQVSNGRVFHVGCVADSLLYEVFLETGGRSTIFTVLPSGKRGVTVVGGYCSDHYRSQVKNSLAQWKRCKKQWKWHAGSLWCHLLSKASVLVRAWTSWSQNSYASSPENCETPSFVSPWQGLQEALKEDPRFKDAGVDPLIRKQFGEETRVSQEIGWL